MRGIIDNASLETIFFISYAIYLAVLGPQMAMKKAINLMKVICVIEGLVTIPETYHAHI